MKIELFLDFEKKYNLMNKEVEGIRYWDVIRTFAFFFIQSEFDKTSNIIDMDAKVKRKIYWRNALNYFRRTQNVDILFVSDPRRFKFNDTYLNIFTDTISSHLNEKYNILTIEEPSWVAKGCEGLPAHSLPINDDHVMFVDMYEWLFFAFKPIIIKRNKSFVKKLVQEYNILFQKIEKYFNVDISYVKNEFIHILVYFKSMEKKYTELIKSITPRLVILNYRPTYFKQMMIYICNKMNISTVELQHGIINKNEPMNRLCNNEYSLCMPNYLFTFGEKLIDYSYIRIKNENIISVGFPFLEEISNYENKKWIEFNENYEYILVVSQSVLGESLAEFTYKLSNELKKYNKYKIIFKYHPNEYTRTYKQLEEENIISIKGKDANIYDLQKIAICQIGVYSTSIYEGLFFQLPTFILEKYEQAKEVKEKLMFMSKGVYFINDEIDVVKCLKCLSSPEVNEVNLLWEENSLYKTLNAICRLLE